MDDHEILQHLLSLENEAAALVDDAQAEADRRVAEGEKQSRALYDEIYAKEIETLETSLAEKIALTRNNYREQLESYHNEIKTVRVNTEAFFSLAEKFLFSKEP